MPRNVTIEIDDDMGLEDIERVFSENERTFVKDWIEKHNSNLVAEVKSALEGIGPMVSGLQSILTDNQGRMEQALVDMLKLTQNKEVDLSPLLKAIQESSAAQTKAINGMSKAISAIKVEIPAARELKGFKLERKWDSNTNLPLLEYVRTEYE